MATAIIEECLRSTEELLTEDWDQIESMKEDNDGKIKVTVAYLISYRGNEQAVKTTLTFGRKVTVSRESIVNPEQMVMFPQGTPDTGNGSEPEEGELDEQTKKTPKKGAKAAP
jgi:hypothetical protein